MTIGFNPIEVAQTNIIIESGTYNGSFTDRVKGDYKHVHTIEIVDKFYQDAVKKFKNDDNITCHRGDSPVVLRKILAQIDEPVSFWLDAHYQGGSQPNATKKPLLEELKAIAGHHIKDHVIMIDDVRLFDVYGTTTKEIEKILKDINPEYTIKYCDGVQANDVIVAMVK